MYKTVPCPGHENYLRYKDMNEVKHTEQEVEYEFQSQKEMADFALLSDPVKEMIYRWVSTRDKRISSLEQQLAERNAKVTELMAKEIQTERTAFELKRQNRELLVIKDFVTANRHKMHSSDCHVAMGSNGYKCTCGLDKALGETP